MKLSIGIVGLPNVGKSTLFKLLTNQNIDIANYPFCTIDPNIGIVSVPDTRLTELTKISSSKKTVPAIVEFFDIAGLVKGASEGAGLGNKFLSHIREVSAIVMVLRCFNNDDIIHVENSVDPLRDLSIINTELILKDLETVTKRLQGIDKEIKSGSKDAVQEKTLLETIKAKLEAGKLITEFSEEKIIINLGLLSSKKRLYLLNGQEADVSPALKETILKEGSQAIIADLSASEEAFRPALEALIRASYETLGLMSFYTTGEEESRAWTIKKGMTGKEAAGVIHTDFEQKFIKAEIVSYEDLIALGGWNQAKQKGKLRLEGKDYIVRDGDVIVFRHG